ncbi:MAG TPA: YicC/YloC family endoribonuclease [Vicinamibacterales bacterium]|nr:YicC/YloC family endoribonuclease [Vicinamibacterales bacterium]
MTGFASVRQEDARGTLGLTIRAVNHRFLDLQIRLPSNLADLEPRLRSVLQKRLARGRIELTASLQLRQGVAPQVELQEDFVRAVVAAIDVARERGFVQGELTPGDLVRMPQAMAIGERATDTDTLGGVLGPAMEVALDTAIDQLDAMRTREGEHLAADLAGRKEALGRLIAALAEAADTGRRDLEARLMERVKELMTTMPSDPTLIAQEIVRVAQRSDITEEVTRFRGHLAHWDALAGADEPCGRKLDFLLQEMNREINTIGSKADGLHVSELIIEAKAELERMREQVQNVE